MSHCLRKVSMHTYVSVAYVYIRVYLILKYVCQMSMTAYLLTKRIIYNFFESINTYMCMTPYL